MITLNDIRRLDADDRLAPIRELFHLPEGLIYLDGNSLGALSLQVTERVASTLKEEWGNSLIGSWNEHGWIELPVRVGQRIAKIIGAKANEVVVTDSTSVNLFKLLGAALKMRLGRSLIVSNIENFPTDLYVAQGLRNLCQEAELQCFPIADLEHAVRDDVAVLMLTQVDFRTGELLDIGKWTRLAHDHGALCLWDLSHSAGVVEVDLNGAEVDLAVGCTYKYLNGGPGAPAFLYIAEKLHEEVTSPICGWLGHSAPFAFSPRYQPAAGIERMLCGTPPILSMVALDSALEVFDRVEIAEIRKKSEALTDLFIHLIEQECADCEFEIVSPRSSSRRGSQVSLRHPEGFPIVRALISRGVVGDFRAPDLMRFGLSPLYLKFSDVWSSVAILRSVMDLGDWKKTVHQSRTKVT
jgi:kynureninase